MNAIVILLLVRVIVPLAVLFGCGEWMRRREANYWARM